jgi:hypothetical protein
MEFSYHKYHANIVRQYNGFIILAQNVSDYQIKVNKINRGDTKGFYTDEHIIQPILDYKYFVGCDPVDTLNWWQKILKKLGFYKKRPKINIEVFKINNNIIEHIKNK